MGLDIGPLVVLLSADRALRTAVRDVALDVEHFAKVHLLDRAVAEGEDGHAIVSDYLQEWLSSHPCSRFSSGLVSRGRPGDTHDEHPGDPIVHYMEQGYPLWVFQEVIEFWCLCNLWHLDDETGIMSAVGKTSGFL